MTIERFEKTIVRANPIRGRNEVSLTISTLDYNTLNTRLKSLEDVVDFQLNMLKDDPDVAIIEDDSIKIGNISGHKTIYSISFKSLVDKVMKIWMVVGDTIYQASLEASNPLLFEAYYNTSMEVINNMKISK